MTPEAAIQEFLERWRRTTLARDADRHADLFLRDPEPVVVFSDGERASDWLDVRVRLARDFSRVALERVDVHHVVWRDLGPHAGVASFVYDLHVRDVWGTTAVASRLATMTLVDTKDGYRIAAAHFSRA